MKVLKKNWLIVVIGIHIALRLILSSYVTNDEVILPAHKLSAAAENIEPEGLAHQIVLMD